MLTTPSLRLPGLPLHLSAVLTLGLISPVNTIWFLLGGWHTPIQNTETVKLNWAAAEPGKKNDFDLSHDFLYLSNS